MTPALADEALSFLSLLLRSQRRKYALSGGDFYRYQRFIERPIAVSRTADSGSAVLSLGRANLGPS